MSAATMASRRIVMAFTSMAIVVSMTQFMFRMPSVSENSAVTFAPSLKSFKLKRKTNTIPLLRQPSLLGETLAKPQVAQPLPQPVAAARSGISAINLGRAFVPTNRATNRANFAARANRVPPQRMVYGNCDCTNPNCYLCQRGMIQVHKMGVTLLNTVVAKYFKRVQTAEIVGSSKLGQKFRDKFQNPPYPDYRQIVVTRNFYDAIISGYLYHRKGMECDLDWFGRPWSKGWLLNNKDENWEARIKNSRNRELVPWPEGKGRDLCTYLKEESERDGVRVYLEWVLDIHFVPLVDFIKQRKARESLADFKSTPKTMFLCFENLVTDYESTVKKMHQWYYPGTALIQVTTEGKTDRDKRDTSNLHATEKDPDLLTRLRALIDEFDQKLFGDFIASNHAVLGCGVSQ